MGAAHAAGAGVVEAGAGAVEAGAGAAAAASGRLAAPAEDEGVGEAVGEAGAEGEAGDAEVAARGALLLVVVLVVAPLRAALRHTGRRAARTATRARSASVRPSSRPVEEVATRLAGDDREARARKGATGRARRSLAGLGDHASAEEAVRRHAVAGRRLRQAGRSALDPRPLAAATATDRSEY